MDKPTLSSLLQILKRSRDYSGDPVVVHGASPEEVDASATAIGMDFPPDLRAWLSEIDTFEVPGVAFYGAKEILKMVEINSEYRSVSFLPIGGDSSGNDYVMALNKNRQDPPILFVAGIIDRTSPCFIAASSLYRLIKFSLERSLSYDDSLWPGDKDYVIGEDPEIAAMGYPLPWES